MQSETALKLDIKSLPPDRLGQALEGQPSFRASQVFQWLHQKRVLSFSEMTNLPASLRERLEQQCYINSLSVDRKQVSAKDGTIKYLFTLGDGNRVETVLMSYAHGNSLCISSQVGCRMGCSFCASTIGGLVRSLSASEMLDQVYAAEADSGRHVDSLVVMGIGEPLENFDSLLDFLRILSSPQGKNLSLRHVSVSTCGLVDQIKALAAYRLGITLSISLHAPNDKLRREIMPIAAKWTIKELVDSCKEYFSITGRRVSYEYALIGGVNDTEACAAELAELLRGTGSHINLIPVNPVTERNYRRSSRQDTQRFLRILRQNGLNSTVRRELGSDIDAACGQLRRKAGFEGGQQA